MLSKQREILVIKFFKMRKRILLHISFQFLCTGLYSQNELKISQGLYFGGDSYEKAMTRGYYWFGKDSSFFMVSFKNDTSIYTIGTGKYYLTSENLFIRSFENMPSLFFRSNKVNYVAETKMSTDSIYFSGEVSDASGIPVKLAGISFPSKEISGLKTDTMGKYHIAIFAKEVPEYIYFQSPFGCPLKLQLLPNYNYHSINLGLTWDCLLGNRYSKSAYELMESRNDTSQIKRVDKNIIWFNDPVKLEKISDNKDDLIRRLIVAKNRQPNLVKEIDWFIEKLFINKR